MHPSESAPPIASRRNALIRRIARLDQEASVRHEEGVYLLWGWKSVEEALREPERIERILIGAGAARRPSGRSLLRRLDRAGLPAGLVEERLLEEVVPGAGDQGLLALARMNRATPKEMLERSGAPLLVVADRIQDPGNMGALIRLGEAAGIAGMLHVPGTVDPYHTRAARASAGSILRMRVGRISGPADLTASPGRPSLRIVATLPEGGTPCHRADFRGPLALVVGNEGEGVSSQWLEAADVRLTVALEGTVQSLNVTLAAAMALYEAFRQRRGPDDGGS